MRHEMLHSGDVVENPKNFRQLIDNWEMIGKVHISQSALEDRRIDLV